MGLDGCHLKGQNGGVLFSIVGLDGNNELFPLVIGIVKKECKNSWQWFMIVLEEVIGSNYEGSTLTFMNQSKKKKRLTFMSDKQMVCIEF